ncbi:hypothetical protein GCM10027258_12090 [Amycolatopsis stemonae]
MDVTPRRGPAFLALVVLALALTVLGTFLPLYRTEQPLGVENDGVARSVVRAWRIDFTFPGSGEIASPSAPLGAPLLLAGALFLVALVLGIRQAVTGHAGAAARRATLVAAAFLAGTVCTIGVQGARSLVDDHLPRTQTTLLAGLWVLIAAVAVAAAAAVLAHRTPAAGRPEWADPEAAFADTATPPSGVSITVLPPADD